MPVKRYAAAVLFTVIFATTAFAGSDIPDLKGVWTMTHEAMVQSNHHEPQSKLHTPSREGFVYIDSELTIDKQEGALFSGTKASSKRTEKVSGVIGYDNQSVYMADEDGLLFCRIIGPNRMEQIYLHVNERRSLAGRGLLIRK